MMELGIGVDDLSADLTITASDEAKRIVNPIRNIVDGRNMPTNPDKELLNLSVGKLAPRIGLIDSIFLYASYGIT